MLKFSAPYYLLLLLPLTILVWRIMKPRSFGEIIFGSTICLPKTKITWRIILSRILPATYLTALGIIIIALAKPESVSSTNKNTVEAIAIEMLLDTSGSMETIDTNKTPRIKMAKESFTDFIKYRKNDLIGIVTFSGYSTTMAPLTTNHEILLQLLESITTSNKKIKKHNTISQQETLTALGDAITTACARLKPAQPKSKIIVLITDGMSNTGLIPPLKAAYIAKKLNIKVYPINIGSSGNNNDQSALLNQIAKTTGGKTFSTINHTELTNILAEIDKLEKTEVKTSYLSEVTDYTKALIAIALLLIIFSTITNIAITRRMI